MDQMTYIFIFIILLALAFAIVNTMLMAILERTREIGMLMAIGMGRTKIFLMIMLETIFLSVTGGILGIIAGVAFNSFFGIKGLDFSMFAEGLSSVGYSPVVYPEIGLPFYIILTFMVIMTAMVASVYPARKALGLKPTEAIRYDH